MNREQQREQSYERTRGLLRHAYTRTEIEEAEAALRAHLAAFPEDERREMDHGWFHKVEAMKEREAQARALGLTAEQHAEREQMLKATRVNANPVAEPDCLARYDRARAQVARWLERFPSDPAARSRLEYLDREEVLAKEVLETLRSLEPLTAA